MINVLYIAIGPFSGGPVVSLLELVSSLDKTRFKPYVLVLPNPHNNTIKSLSNIENLTIVKTDIWINNWLYSATNENKGSLWHQIKFPGRVARSVWNGIKISRLIRKYQIDIVHTNLELIIDGAIAAFLSGKPHIWHIRAPLGKNGVVTHFLGQRFCCMIISFLSKKVIVNSKATLQSVERYIDYKKIELIYNGIYPVTCSQKSSACSLRSLLEIQTTDRIIASIGYLSKLKGGDTFIRTAIEICNSIDNVVFVWIGPAKERNDDKFCIETFELIRSERLEKRILFTGERNDIFNLLSDVDIFMHPMKNGSWSRVVLEAMFSALPVVAIEESMQSEIIENLKTGFLVKNDFELIDTLKAILLNGKNFSYIKRNAKHHIETNFTTYLTTEHVMNQYESISR